MSAMAAPRGEVTMPMRQGPFPLGREQSLGGQLLFELLEGQLQRAEALGFEQFHQQLVFAARLVDVDAAARQHCQAILRAELPVAVRRAERHALEHGIPLFEGEIVVAAGGQFESRDFARHPDFGELVVERRADGGIQFADGEDAALRDELELEGELLQATMVARRRFAKTIQPRMNTDEHG
jgi:hypothetical protein